MLLSEITSYAVLMSFYIKLMSKLKYVLLKHLFFQWIIIQTHIRNTDSYSDADSKTFILTLATNDFP